MPLPSGEEIAAFRKRWFEERGVELICAACGRSCWQPTQYAAAPWVSATGEFIVGEAERYLFYQLLPLYCKNCGFVVFFNAGMMGNMPSYFPEQVIKIEDSGQTM
jgi:hypothetical protein